MFVFFQLHTMALIAKVFWGLPTLIAKSSLICGFSTLELSVPYEYESTLLSTQHPGPLRDGPLFLRVPKHWQWNKDRPVPAIQSKMNPVSLPANCPCTYSSARACQGLPGMTQALVTMGDSIPIQMLQNKSSVLRQAGSLKTHQDCFIGIKLVKETTCICQSQRETQEVQCKAEV